MSQLKPLGRREFIALAAFLTAIVAVSVDLMLPGLGDLASDLRVASGNDRQWVITTLMIGLVFGQLVFGPASDAYGRKSTMLVGAALFITGTLICAYASSFNMLLAGRFLQGFGAAGPRNGTVAMVRDRFVGEEMAKIMSVVMGIFVFVPIFAPMVGQALLFFMTWRGLFVVLGVLYFLAAIWLLLRQPETLENPKPLQPRALWQATLSVFGNRCTLFITVAAGCAYGALMGYVNSAQQILQDTYQVGNAFALWFGVTAVFISSAMFTNARLVNHVPMITICRVAVALVCVLSGLFAALVVIIGQPTVLVWIGFNCAIMFLLGLTFGNFAAIALQPFGHLAGLAGALHGSGTIGIAMVFASTIGLSFNGTVNPILYGYTFTAALAFFCIFIAGKASVEA